MNISGTERVKLSKSWWVFDLQTVGNKKKKIHLNSFCNLLKWILLLAAQVDQQRQLLCLWWIWTDFKKIDTLLRMISPYWRTKAPPVCGVSWEFVLFVLWNKTRGHKIFHTRLSSCCRITTARTRNLCSSESREKQIQLWLTSWQLHLLVTAWHDSNYHGNNSTLWQRWKEMTYILMLLNRAETSLQGVSSLLENTPLEYLKQ